MNVAEESLIYLYCVTKAKPDCSDFEETGIKVYPIYFQGTYAILSRVSPEEFSEENLKKNLANMEWVEKNVRQHEKVIEEIMKDITVIPFKFGTIFKTEKSVENLLKENNLKFKNVIADLEGKEEWGLKVYCDSEKLNDSLKKENERVQGIEKEITSSGKGKAYFLKKKKNELIKNVRNEKISEYTQDSFERIKRACLEAKINKILSKEVTEKKEDMVLNAAFLMNEKRIKEFENILAYLKTKYTNEGLIFDCTGPWPPYNFCNLSENGKVQNE